MQASVVTDLCVLLRLVVMLNLNSSCKMKQHTN